MSSEANFPKRMPTTHNNSMQPRMAKPVVILGLCRKKRKSCVILLISSSGSEFVDPVADT